MNYTERNKNINRGFRKLEIWQEAVKLFKFLKQKIDSINSISYKTKAQIEDSALSVSSNIAEGYARRSIKENIQFNNIALASLAENYSQTYNLYNAEIIEEEWFNSYDELHYSLENKLINFNKAQIKMLKNSDEWRDDYIVKELIEKYDIKRLDD
ncbi:MAG: four helix bundle protein [Bacteroidetes bacterium]|nr:four helix bundle protein [Bacteroidota bacterium]MBU2506739.1 four helix bundle protein [Bacteroidota bacterium]